MHEWTLVYLPDIVVRQPATAQGAAGSYYFLGRPLLFDPDLCFKKVVYASTAPIRS